MHDHIFVLTDLMSLHRTHNLNQTHKTLNHFHKSKAKHLSIIRQLKVIVAEILGFSWIITHRQSEFQFILLIRSKVFTNE